MKFVYSYKKIKPNKLKQRIEIKNQIAKKHNLNGSDCLQKNLKHLEFINFLEAQFNIEELDKFQTDFVQSFQKIKIKAQQNTLNCLKNNAA